MKAEEVFLESFSVQDETAVAELDERKWLSGFCKLYGDSHTVAGQADTWFTLKTTSGTPSSGKREGTLF